MKIAVNTRLLLKNELEGIGWFTYESLKRITQKYSEHEFIFIFDRKFSDEFIFSKNITPVVVPPQSRHPLLWYLWFDWSVSNVLKKHKPDLFLSPDGYLSQRTKVPSLAVIHDINFVHRPQDLPFLSRKYYNYYFPRFAKKAKRIATVSEFSKQDIVDSYNIPPSKIDVVYNGASNVYKPVGEEIKKSTKEKYSQNCDYFLFVGALNPRKNVENLLRAFDEFKKSSLSNMKLVIVGGKMFKTSSIEQVFNQMLFNKDVVFTGRLEQSELQNVMASAHTLSFVPIFEGFGIPILEAMYCDVPVITSNVTSMPEVGGDAALLIEPTSVDSIKNAMLQIVKDETLRINLIEKGKIQREKFSWDKTSEKLWESIVKTEKL